MTVSTAGTDPGVRTVYLLRHCTPVCPPGGKRYIGQSDPPLAREGIRQAEKWRAFFRRIALTAVYCSDLRRARQTARILFNDHLLSITGLPDLREVNMGDWEGRRFDSIRRDDPQGYAMRGNDPAEHCPPGGESFRDLHDRVVPAFTHIVKSTTGNVAVVGHAGVNRVLLCHLLNVPLARLFSMGQDPGGLNIILVRPDWCRVAAINVPPFLP